MANTCDGDLPVWRSDKYLLGACTGCFRCESGWQYDRGRGGGQYSRELPDGRERIVFAISVFEFVRVFSGAARSEWNLRAQHRAPTRTVQPEHLGVQEPGAHRT